MSGETESLRKKVATLTVINGALQKENDDLRAAASTHHADGKGGANNGDASSIVAQVEAECEARLREADAQIDELRRELATIAKGGDAAQSSARDKTHFLVIPKIRSGLTQLSKAEEGHKELLGHLLYTAQKVAKQEKLDAFLEHEAADSLGYDLDMSKSAPVQLQTLTWHRHRHWQEW